MGNITSKFPASHTESPQRGRSTSRSDRRSQRKMEEEVVFPMPSPVTSGNSSSKGKTSRKLKLIDGRGFNDGELVNPKYMLPVDDLECDRLTIQHYSLRNYSAPIKEQLEKGISVLDSGCGTGIWCLEMGTDYPNSTFVGTDIAASFPIDIHPSNVSFFNADTTVELPFPDETFDYVFQRMLTLAFSVDAWESAIKELIRVTKPGGFVELVLHTLSARNINGRMSLQLGDRLIEHGLKDVTTSYKVIPTGWSGRIGELTGQVLQAAIPATKPVLLQIMAISEEEFDAMATEALREFPQYKTVNDVWYAFGRKPMEKEGV
ncbi:S-adenosyl-L-methionine-dependent methyltransferase [Endogone sp. FLAS-F59071]|nr:S-adenosyl-L-methionine-dependent methyltransferase [Endogone sp. FLAS-F59071]|eukprot:RUS16232.1 S-adenosyl-L-methionine-dependent methyltransferase [Endogone sp. FLAS-F59071]